MASVSHIQAARTLWKRAPWWRLAAMASCLLTLLMVLFPPRAKIDRNGGPALDTATYERPVEPLTVTTQAALAPSPATPSLSAVAKSRPTPLMPPRSTSNSAATPGPVSLALARPGASEVSIAGIDPGLIGHTYHQQIPLGGFSLPLPPGEWAMLANSTAHLTNHPANTGMQYFFGRIEHARLTGALQANALRSPDDSGFDTPGTCSSQGNLYTHKDENTALLHQGCWTVHLVFTAGMERWADKAIKMSGIYRMAGGDLAAKGVTYPQEMIAVHFFRSESWGLLEAVYHFSPDADNIHSNVAPTLSDSDWSQANVQKYAEKLAYIEKLKVWADVQWPRFNAAFEAGRASPTSR